MAKCKKCNKRGFFLKLNTDGLCDECAKKSRQELYEQKQKEKIAKAREEINSIPKYDIKLSTIPRKRQTGYTAPKFSNITPKGKYDSYVVFDTETTGLTPSRDRIIELAAIKVQSGVAISRFHSYVNPERVIPAEASAINHITNEMVKNAPKISEVLPAFEEFVGENILIAHNLEFDLKFLFYSGSILLDTKRKYIDTLQQSKKMLKKSPTGVNCFWRNEVGDYKLETLCSYFNITLSDQHSALGDVYATTRLFATLVYLKQDNNY